MAKKDGFTYKYKQKLNVGDPLNYPIIRGNVEEEFSLALVLQNYNLIKKQMAEESGKLKIAEAMKEEIEKKNPEVLKYTDLQLVNAALYQNALFEIKKFKNNAKEYEIALKEYRRGFKEVTSELNLDVPFPTD